MLTNINLLFHWGGEYFLLLPDGNHSPHFLYLYLYLYIYIYLYLYLYLHLYLFFCLEAGNKSCWLIQFESIRSKRGKSAELNGKNWLLLMEMLEKCRDNAKKMC